MIEVPFLPPGLVERHQRLDVGAGSRTPEGARCKSCGNSARACRFLVSGRRTTRENPGARWRLFRRRGVERPFDTQRSDMREERETRRRSGLHRVAHEVLIEVEHRREVRRRERGPDHVRAGGGLETRTHRRAAAAAEERFRPLLSTARRSAAATTRSAPYARRRRSALATAVGRRRTEPAAALPVDQLQALAVEQDFELLARYGSEAGRRHVVAENRRHRHRVLAGGGEEVLDEDAAARAERQPFDVIVLRRVFRRAVHLQVRRRGLADRQAADLARRRYVRFHER